MSRGHRDAAGPKPGLAAERTALAWSRTAMGLLVVSGLLVRFAERGRAPVAGELAAALALATSGGVWWHARRLHQRSEPPTGPQLRVLSAVTLGVVAVAIATSVAVALALI
ncbi:MAG: DUF202 domain-containing protein [Solirubrobacteraceae bacterium]